MVFSKISTIIRMLTLSSTVKCGQALKNGETLKLIFKVFILLKFTKHSDACPGTFWKNVFLACFTSQT